MDWSQIATEMRRLGVTELELGREGQVRIVLGTLRIPDEMPNTEISRTPQEVAEEMERLLYASAG